MTTSEVMETADASRVLLIGSQWDSVSATLKSLSGQGGLTFVGPSDRGTPEILSLVHPAVIMVGPGCDTAEALGPLDSLKDETDKTPVLVCVTLDDLEGNALSWGYGGYGGYGDYGAYEDFLVVPCSAAELSWRLQRLARRNLAEVDGSRLEVGNITLDTCTYQVSLSGRVVPLAWMEFQLLKFLMDNVGRIFTRDVLLSTVWGFDSFGGTRTVDVHIRKLRSKLEIHGERYFRTVKNVGYGMVVPS